MDLLNYEEKPQTRTGYFWWSVIILLLTGACFASWIGSFYIVSHPENPKCYKLLKRLKRLDSPKRFQIGHGSITMPEVPHGDFLSVPKILDRFGKLGPEELARENARLLRGYLMGFHEAKKRLVNVGGKMVPQQDVVYVVGRFEVVEARALGPGDLFPSGAVVLAQSLESPQALVEAVFPANNKTGRALEAALPAGSRLALERSLDLVALLHIDRLDDGRMQFTAIPLTYGGWQTRRGDARFSLKSPEELEKDDPRCMVDVAAGLPIVRGERLKKATSSYLDHRRKSLADGGEEETWTPDLLRFDSTKDETDGAVTPKVVRPPAPPTVRTQPTPAPAVPLVVRPLMVPPGATPTPVAPTPRPLHAPAPTVPAIVPTVVPAVVPAKVGMAAPLPGRPAPQVPRRVVTVQEASQFATDFSSAPPSILSGEFVVASVTGRRVELRAKGAETAGAGPVNIVVDFPPAAKLPVPGAPLRREALRGFVIKNVARAAGGEIIIEAAEQAP